MKALAGWALGMPQHNHVRRDRAACSSVLAAPDTHPHVQAMFVVDEPTAEAIRRAYLERGELSAVVELRRHFPGIVDNENARRCVRTIASWQPLPPLPPKKPRVRRTTSSTP